MIDIRHDKRRRFRPKESRQRLVCDVNFVNSTREINEEPSTVEDRVSVTTRDLTNEEGIVTMMTTLIQDDIEFDVDKFVDALCIHMSTNHILQIANTMQKYVFNKEG